MHVESRVMLLVCVLAVGMLVKVALRAWRWFGMD